MRDDTISTRGLRAAITLVAAEAGNVSMTQDELLDGVTVEEALAALVALAAAALPFTGLLPHLGSAVARLPHRDGGGKA
ncbi:hypothetical protein [Streptantibioticus silvisoli]|uniref:Carboxymuconolactone decarboxylase family protein n=1 Tax=Streptantibioticus silvisoli TaxID=2705255 RepID=A0ABT6W582_9ACTN|nr:hypothetical protein [Streptantibioticus silvisoli]MDI5964818.1 hypothetical protein [Streptantibioticus silvisoli]